MCISKGEMINRCIMCVNNFYSRYRLYQYTITNGWTDNEFMFCGTLSVEQMYT